MRLFKLLPIAFCCAGLSLVACGDDSSSGASNEEESPASSDDGQLFHLSSVAAKSSSSSVSEPNSSEGRGQFVPESSSAPAHPGQNCASDVFPNVSIRNIESVNMACNSGTEGWLVLIEDQNKLLTCKAGNWEEQILDDC